MMRILLLDDHKLFGQSIKMLLEENEEIEECNYISAIEDLFIELDKGYDILLLDVNLKAEKTGLDLISDVLTNFPNQKIIILTSYDLVNYKDRAFELGVKDFVNKSVEIEDLVRSIKTVYQGRSKLEEVKIENRLTDREMDVLKELVKGDSKKLIADRLYISERTLYNHIASIYEKLEVNNIVEAYNKAMEIGYINPIM